MEIKVHVGLTEFLQRVHSLPGDEFELLLAETHRRLKSESESDEARPPVACAQFDGRLLWSRAYLDQQHASMITESVTREYMDGGEVRVLVSSGTSPDIAVRLLINILARITSNPKALSRTSVEGPPNAKKVSDTVIL